MKLEGSMKCNEPCFIDTIAYRVKYLNGDTFRYLEMGCASGSTLCAVAEELERVVPGKWQAIGVDKPTEQGGWWYDRERVKACAGDKFAGIIPVGVAMNDLPKGKIFLNESGNEGFVPFLRNRFDIILIDACHSCDCAKRDFLMCERLVKPDGFIFFHDSDPLCQGGTIDIQPHCHQPVGVRLALDQLGFLNNLRPNWVCAYDSQPPGSPGDRGLFSAHYTGNV